MMMLPSMKVLWLLVVVAMTVGVRADGAGGDGRDNVDNGSGMMTVMTIVMWMVGMVVVMGGVHGGVGHDDVMIITVGMTLMLGRWW